MSTLFSIITTLSTLTGHKRKELDNTYSENTYWLRQQCAAVPSSTPSDKYHVEFNIEPPVQDTKRKRRAAHVDTIPPYTSPVKPIVDEAAEASAAAAAEVAAKAKKPPRAKPVSKHTTLEHPVQPAVVSIELPDDTATSQPAAGKKTRGAAKAVAQPEPEKPARATRAVKKAVVAEPTIEPVDVPAEEPVVEIASKKPKKAAAGKKAKKTAADEQQATATEPITVDTETPVVDEPAVAPTPLATYDVNMQITDTTHIQPLEPIVEQPTASARSSARKSKRASSKPATPAVKSVVDATPTSLSATLSASVDSDSDMDGNTIVNDTADDAVTHSTTPTSVTSSATGLHHTYDMMNKHNGASSSSNSLTKPLGNSVMGVSAVSLASSMMHNHHSAASNMVRPSVPGVNLSALSTVKVPILQHKPQQSITVPLSQQHNITNSTTSASAAVTAAQRASIGSVDSKSKRLSQQRQDAAKAAETASIKQKYELSKQLHDANVAEAKRVRSRSNSHRSSLLSAEDERAAEQQLMMELQATKTNGNSDIPVSMDDIDMNIEDGTDTVMSQSTITTTASAVQLSSLVKPATLHAKHNSTELTQPQLISTVKSLVKPAVLDVAQIKAQKELLAAQHKQKQLIAEARRKQLDEENRKMQALKDAERAKREEDAAKIRANLLKQKTAGDGNKYGTLTQPQPQTVGKVTGVNKPLVKVYGAVTEHAVPITMSASVQPTMPAPAKPILQSITNITANAKPVTNAAAQLQPTQPQQSPVATLETPKKSLVVTNAANAATQAAQQPTPSSIVKAGGAKGAHFSFSPAHKMPAATPVRPPIKTADAENYEMSDHSGSDSESEADQQQNSRGKKVPAWARDPLLTQELNKQIDTDPDLVFPQMPDSCDLTVIFKSFRQNERFRKRYSSGNWTGDQLTRMDEITYKKHMGYVHQNMHATL